MFQIYKKVKIWEEKEDPKKSFLWAYERPKEFKVNNIHDLLKRWFERGHTIQFNWLIIFWVLIK